MSLLLKLLEPDAENLAEDFAGYRDQAIVLALKAVETSLMHPDSASARLRVVAAMQHLNTLQSIHQRGWA